MTKKKKICIEHVDCKNRSHSDHGEVKIDCRECRGEAFKKAEFSQDNICRNCLEYATENNYDWPRPKGIISDDCGPVGTTCKIHKEKFVDHCKKCREAHVTAVGDCTPCADSRIKFEPYNGESCAGWRICERHVETWKKWQTQRWITSKAFMKKALPIPVLTPDLIERLKQVCTVNK